MDLNTALIPIAGIMVPIIIVPTVLGLRHARLLRELDHAERMKAMDMRRPLPGDESWSWPARIAFLFGVGVPIGVFFCAWMATDPKSFEPIPWISAGVVGLAGVLSGAFLANRHLSRSTEGPGLYDRSYDKPQVDADAFDVVGSRG